MIRLEHAHLPVAALTHPGMVGKNNEDSFLVSAFRLEDAKQTPSLLAVLSDGIGGHRAGEVASAMAVETISQLIGQSDASRPTHLLQSAIIETSRQIRDAAQADPNRAGMGATCSAAWIIGNRLYAATVGDSRIYLMRNATIRQISTDHTWVQEALDLGFIQPGEERNHPNAHVIRRYLGSPEDPKVDVRMRLAEGENDNQAEANQGLVLRPGDRLLLCSDGLTDLVDDHEILETFQTQPLLGAAQSLVDLANQRGGHDNITLVAVEIPQPVKGTKPLARKKKGTFILLLVALMVVIGLLAAALLGGWLIQRKSPVTPTPGPGTPVLTVMWATPVDTQTSDSSLLPPATLVPTPSPTLPFLPPEVGGATFTPWPTNTLAPTPTPGG